MIVVLDNGAGTLRGGWAGDETPRSTMPNCTAKVKGQQGTLAGDETIDAVRDKALITYQRPHDRGYLINWETQVQHTQGTGLPVERKRVVRVPAG